MSQLLNALRSVERRGLPLRRVVEPLSPEQLTEIEARLAVAEELLHAETEVGTDENEAAAVGTTDLEPAPVAFVDDPDWGRVTVEQGGDPLQLPPVIQLPAIETNAETEDEEAEGDKSTVEEAEEAPADDGDALSVWSPVEDAEQGTAGPARSGNQQNPPELPETSPRPEIYRTVEASLADPVLGRQYRDLASQVAVTLVESGRRPAVFLGCDEASRLSSHLVHVGVLLARRQDGDVLVVDGDGAQRTLCRLLLPEGPIPSAEIRGLRLPGLLLATDPAALPAADEAQPRFTLIDGGCFAGHLPEVAKQAGGLFLGTCLGNTEKRDLERVRTACGEAEVPILGSVVLGAPAPV